MPIATGPFSVKMTMQALAFADETRGRASLEKTYEGTLAATALGEMLTGGDYRSGSAGYVAVETVTGSLDGKSGRFLLQHSSTMDAGKPMQSITVIPGTGTEALTGLRGSMTIEIEQGQHSYRFDYTLP